MNAPLAYTLGQMQQGPACCTPQPILQVRNLSIAYGPDTVLSQVSLDIHRGCITALIGPSGCGKTSFLSALNRLTDLMPGAAVQGDIHLDGQDIRSPGTDLRHLRQRIGMVFQRPNPFPLSIQRNLALPLREHGITRRDELAYRIQMALAQVGLWHEVKDRLNAPALSLSGGQQQRLCMARALVLQPDILLMDEPCSALDPLASAVVEDLIASLQGRYTVVIVTHNLAQARRIAHFAAFFWMKERVGRLVEFGACQQVFTAPKDALTAAYVQGQRG